MAPMMFGKILIANRGEIACRVMRTARRLGVATVAVYSDADANALHVRSADEAIRIGPAQARESYLAIDNIIAAAKRTGAEAIHPGYGFLSESALFPSACDAAGIIFIGPPLAAMQAMASKSEAKKLMQAAGVPLAPGYHGDDQDPALLRREADALGYPLLVKAVLGGGGKGMRLVERAADFDAALAACKREAAASFGDENVLIEKYIQRPRHIEIQVFGDSFGECIALYERDCSVQRRRQKIVEEAPAPGLRVTRRQAMSEAAVAAAKAVGYVGAGTVEFVVAPDGAFYFMEMNTRLQVEHPVTEMVTGLDLVEWQLRIAAGAPLPLRQQDIRLQGHAIEARIYAEDPTKDFLPGAGRIAHLELPEQDRHVRVDAGVEEGDVVTPFYDPMIAKLIVWDNDRERALARLRRALAEVHIAGVANNVEFLSRLVASPSFADANLDVDLIERESTLLFRADDKTPRTAVFVAALTALLAETAPVSCGNDFTSPWNARDNWRLNHQAPRKLTFSCHDETFDVSAWKRGEFYALRLDDREAQARGWRDARGKMRVELDGAVFSATTVATEQGWTLFAGGRVWSFVRKDPLQVASREDHLSEGLTAPMSGRVTALLAQAGGEVKKGAPLMILEAMKMEHVIHAPADGRVTSFLFAQGDQVTEGAQLLDFEELI